MGTKVMLGVVVLGVAVAACGGGDREPDPPAEHAAAPAKPAEPVWLSRAAAAQIIGEDAMPGPLFAGLNLGGPAPPAEVRARIAEFARVNHVDLQLDAVGDKLTAIRFDVSYEGCCGYEGADALGLRLQRPKTYDGCLDCRASGWLDDWTEVSSDGHVFMRAKIRISRVRVRWERALTETELLARADALLGQDYEEAGKAAGAGWHELTFEHAYLIELPYQLSTLYDSMSGVPLDARSDLGLFLVVDRRKIVEVKAEIRAREDQQSARLIAAANKRWGRPRITDSELAWRRPDRTVSACCDGDIRSLSIAKK